MVNIGEQKDTVDKKIEFGRSNEVKEYKNWPSENDVDDVDNPQQSLAQTLFNTIPPWEQRK